MTSRPEGEGHAAASATRDRGGVPERQEEAAEPGEPVGYRALLAGWLDRVEDRLERLLSLGEESGRELAILIGHLTRDPAPSPEEERVAEILTRLEALQGQVGELASSVSRQTRVQFKANTLLDGRGEEVSEALRVLREVATQRDRARSDGEGERGRRLAELRAEGRAELAAELLPVLDGIERALESGTLLLGERRLQAPSDAPAGGLGARLARALIGAPAAPARHEQQWENALEGWIEGLSLGRERFLALLAAEGITPMPALGRPFDPHFQVAVATEPRGDRPPGTVTQVLRTGYRRGERPLRLAEVVVARAPGDGEPGPGPLRADVRHDHRGGRA